MKSILQGVALLSAAALIASCDSSSGGGSAGVGTTPPAPQASVTGTAVKGVIDGGAVTVTDGDGNQVGTGTVTAGVYDITYDADQSGGVLTPPLTVTVTGGTTVCDLDRPNTTNDCATGDAATPFVGFGQSYSLPADFVIRTVDTTVTLGETNNTHGATELAFQTGGTANFTAAGQAVAGLIETVTGISLAGVDITDIGAADTNSAGAASASAASLAIAAFNSAVLSLQTEGEDLQDTFTRLAGLVTFDATTGNITGTGTNLGTLVSAIAQGLRTVGAASGNGAINNAIGAADNLATAYTNIGAGTVTILPQTGVGGDTEASAVELTKTFVGTFGQVLGDVLETTGAAGFGGTDNTSATEAFAAELQAVELATSSNATIALDKLSDSLIASAAEVTADTPVTVAASETSAVAYTMSVDADGVITVADVSSAWPIAADAADRVVITAATGTANGESNVSLPEITMVSNVGSAAAQTFVGSYTTAPNATTATNTDVTLTGTITTTATATNSFGVSISLTNFSDDDTGMYAITFSFGSVATPDVTLVFNGTIGAQTQSYTVTTSNGSINGTVARPEGNSTDGSSDTVTITDGTATLTLTLAQGQFTGGTLSVGETTTGTVDANGLITYTDETIQSLPAIIF